MQMVLSFTNLKAQKNSISEFMNYESLNIIVRTKYKIAKCFALLGQEKKIVAFRFRPSKKIE